MKTKFFTWTILLLAASLAVSCKKSKDNFSEGLVLVHLTDAPTDRAGSDYEEVNLDVQQIKIRTAGSTGGDWIAPHTQAGMYNMVNYAGGNEVLLAKDEIPEGETMQVKLVLGANNTVKVGGQLYPLNLPAGADTGLVVEVYKMISSERQLDIHLAFDLEHSISFERNNYFLRPVMRVLE